MGGHGRRLDGNHARIAVLQTPDGQGQIELFEYLHPEAIETEPTLPNEIGMHRVAFAVDDIDAALEIAARHGCHPLRGVANYQDVYKLTYLRGPSGIIVMLAEEIETEKGIGGSRRYSVRKLRRPLLPVPHVSARAGVRLGDGRALNHKLRFDHQQAIPISGTTLMANMVGRVLRTITFPQLDATPMGFLCAKFECVWRGCRVCSFVRTFGIEPISNT